MKRVRQQDAISSRLLQRVAMIALLAVWLAPSSLASTVPLSDIAPELVATPMTGGPNNEFGWWSRYDIGFTAATSTFNIELRIKLYGADPGDALKTLWEQGIEDIWSGAYQIVQEDEFLYDVAFDVVFVDDIFQSHHLVNVIEGSGPMNMNNWYTENPSGWPQDKQDEAAAHEAGHMFGSFDEYAGGAVNPDGSYPDTPDSLMGSQLTRTLYPRNYQFVADWASGKAPGSTFAVESSLPPPLPPVPLPPAFWLFGAALGWLGWMGRRTRQ